jgi:hypothetical protein
MPAAEPERYGDGQVVEPLDDVATAQTDTEIAALEERAQQLFRELKFTSGSDGNAWDVCKQIRELDPGNAVCQQLITDMKNSYRSWIEASLASGNCDKATAYANALKRIGDATDYAAKIAECRETGEVLTEETGLCPYCGEPTIEGKFCTACGHNLEDLTVVCPRCLKWTADETFCIHCRYRLR